MAGTIKRTFGPLALTTTLTTNVYNNTSALIYDVIKQINVCNKTSSAATFTLYLGATGANAAGTELFTAVSIPANTTLSFPFVGLKLTSTDFLVGGAGTATALTIVALGEQYVV
tara:strand:- start:504 stop:845 length:342 start_codon:yes stop_codon:yes gene_type:complete